MDSPDINATYSGSHLLSMSTPPFPLESQTGPGGDDLLLSELSISNPDSINIANFNHVT